MVRWPLQTIAVAMQKGGAGKTTTTINVGAGLARQGRRVCIVDLDGQRNATTALGCKIDAMLQEDETTPTVLDIFAKKSPAIDLVRPLDGRFVGKLSFIPSHRALSAVFTKLEVSLVHQAQDGLSFEDQQDLRLEAADRLRESLKSLDGEFDAVLIDTPPALDFMLSSALRAADWLIIPLVCARFCKEGLRDLLTSVNKVKERSNPRLKLLRAVIGSYDGRKVLHREFVEDYRGTFGDKLSPNNITEGVRVEELPDHAMTIFEHAPKTDQASQFAALAAEIEVVIDSHLARLKDRQASHPSVEPTQAAVGEV